jgi:hypothetical protein
LVYISYFFLALNFSLDTLRTGLKPRTDGFTDTEYLCVGIVDISNVARLQQALNKNIATNFHIRFQ